MRRSPGPRDVAKLSESASHRLNNYALAASAAGVGMLALVLPSQAKIVYTRANIGLGNGVQLDLNHDGTTDFYILVQTDYGKHSACNVFPAAHNQMLGNGNQASALRAGVRIGPKDPFAASHTLLARFWKKSDTGTSYSSGQWKNVKNRYLGVRFLIQGEIHYGWVRMSIVVNHGVTGVMTGYAYETIPNKPIISGDIVGEARRAEDSSASRVQPASLTTPEPQSATLGALAIGAHGLALWRRKE
jgi:hypothetical protein